MMSYSRRLLVCVWAFAALGVITACGASPATGGSTGPVTGASATTASGPPAGNAQGFCGVVQQQRAVLLGTELSSLLSGGTPAAWKAYLDKTSTMNQQLVDAAPADIRASVKTLQDTTVALQSTLAAADYDVSKVGAANLIKVLQSPEHRDASAAVVAYVKANCGIDLTTVGG